MTDSQILTVTIAIVFPVVAGVISIAALVIANKRLDDFKREILGSMDAFKKEITGTINTGFEHMELLLKLHVAEHHKG